MLHRELELWEKTVNSTDGEHGINLRNCALPVFIDARNSAMFYGLSMLYKPLSTALLVHEMFKQHSKMVSFRVGEPIPQRAFNQPGLTDRARVKLMRDHLYRVAKGKKGLFRTETPAAHPEERQLLKRELKQGELLGETSDHKKIYLCDFANDSALMREIGRLREVTFRAVGEGSGRKRDLDRFDAHYRHLVLWDDEELEVVGAYRLGESNALMEQLGEEGFYTIGYAIPIAEASKVWPPPESWGE